MQNSLPGILGAAIRFGFMLLGPELIRRGYADSSTIGEISGAFITVATFGWSILQKVKTSKRIVSASNAPPNTVETTVPF